LKFGRDVLDGILPNHSDFRRILLVIADFMRDSRSFC